LAVELTELEVTQQNLSSQIDKPLLARYTKLKSARKDQALASLRDGICLGCRLQLPPQLVAEVKRMQDLHTCPYCHRMLYWEAEPASETAVPKEKAHDLEVGESA
jgi:predicted  nucleic acid-binding Zn-ribbon protein